MTNGFGEIAAALGRLLEPISQAAADPVSMEQLAEQLGIIPGSDLDLAPVLTIGAEAQTALDAITTEPDLSFEQISALLGLADTVFTRLAARVRTSSEKSGATC